MYRRRNIKVSLSWKIGWIHMKSERACLFWFCEWAIYNTFDYMYSFPSDTEYRHAKTFEEKWPDNKSMRLFWHLSSRFVKMFWCYLLCVQRWGLSGDHKNVCLILCDFERAFTFLCQSTLCWSHFKSKSDEVFFIRKLQLEWNEIKLNHYS